MKKIFIILAMLFILFLIIIYFVMPHKLFDFPHSSLLFDKSGNLLSAVISDDQSWRFPQSDYDLPEKYKKALLAYEDSRFFYHFGIDAVSVVRALKDNTVSGKIVSGASTVTMQVARLSRGNRQRNFTNKLKEAFLALSIEMHLSKKEILKLYADNAPFGGNIIGYEAASWFYFNRSPGELSWGESAMLAVLPNSPSLIRPGKNSSLLIVKRNKLLKKLYEKNFFDRETYELACMEPLPDKSQIPENHAVHLLYSYMKRKKGIRFNSDIDVSLQKMIELKVKLYGNELKKLNISNISAVVMDNISGKTLAYVGNYCTGASLYEGGCFVDIAGSPRSSGSILKPFLYASMLNDGEITPNMLIPDIPTNYNGYSPENFDMEFRGAVPAMEALRLSLNVPAVKLLQMHGIDKFHDFLKKTGFTTIKRTSENYGLSLILGGAEISLYECVKVYSDMASSLVYSDNGDIILEKRNASSPFIKMRGASYIVLDALTELKRPGYEEFWNVFSNKHKIAWKTGTSFGFRDAWAVGVTPEFTVGIWIGNANGESNNSLTGASVAAPLLFDIFGALGKFTWFKIPESDMKKNTVCRESGFPSNTLCDTEDIYVPRSFAYKGISPYYKAVLINEKGFRIIRECSEGKIFRREIRFVLPPAMEYYYRKNHPEYRGIPSFDRQCKIKEESDIIEITYPVNNGTIYLPINISGIRELAVGKVFYKKNKTLFWHIDGKYAGSTSGIHNLGLNADKGFHELTVSDEDGNTAVANFNVR